MKPEICSMHILPRCTAHSGGLGCLSAARRLGGGRCVACAVRAAELDLRRSIKLIGTAATRKRSKCFAALSLSSTAKAGRLHKPFAAVRNWKINGMLTVCLPFGHKSSEVVCRVGAACLECILAS